MRIISRNEIRILAIHDDMIFMFSIACLESGGSLDKNPDNPETIARRVVGMFIDKSFRVREVVSSGKYHGMIVHAAMSVELTKQRFDELVAAENQISKLKNAGHDFTGNGAGVHQS